MTEESIPRTKKPQVDWTCRWTPFRAAGGVHWCARSSPGNAHNGAYVSLANRPSHSFQTSSRCTRQRAPSFATRTRSCFDISFLAARRRGPLRHTTRCLISHIGPQPFTRHRWALDLGQVYDPTLPHRTTWNPRRRLRSSAAGRRLALADQAEADNPAGPRRHGIPDSVHKWIRQTGSRTS